MYKRNLKWITFTGMIAITFFMMFSNAYAQKTPTTEEEIIQEQAQSDEIKKIEASIQKFISQEAKEFIPGFSTGKMVKESAKGEFKFDIWGFFKKILSYLLKELYSNMHILIQLVALVILCAILRNLQASFLSESVGELAFYACYIVIVTLLILSFNTVLTQGREAVDAMVGFMHATIPVMITLLVSGGNFTSAGVFQPILITIVEISATIMKNFFIPMLLFSTVISIANNISDKVQISRLASFLKQICGWTLGGILTVFIAVVTVQGSLGAVVDGVASKTAKFAIGAFIPIAGKYLADAADAVIGCTLLIKNAAGVAVMVGIIAICIVPLLKMSALIALYRITSVLIEPVSEKRIINCINEVANSLTFILGIVAAVAFMFLISITAMISASNISAMIR